MIEAYQDHHPEIHETAWVHASSVIIGRVVLGEDANIWPNVTIRADEGDVTIGASTNIQDGSTVHLTGGVSDTRIGQRVTVGHMCLLHGCTIEDDVLIGMGSIIMDNAVIGRGSFIGAGTLITPNKVIPPYSFVRGRPYEIVRACGEREAKWIDYSWAHYVQNSKVYMHQKN
ncbi:MAG: gamma carbonic anhydrase family protein [Myxococcota bacterium]|nr:gamma carbonic anhydrase family protein [Myxococcota bacterium]